MMKKLATILLFALFVALPICNVSASGDIQTEYPLETMLLDYEFNEATADKAFSGLGNGSRVFPTLDTVDNEGVAVFDKAVGQGSICLSGTNEAVAPLRSAMESGEVAFEYRFKFTEGTNLHFAKDLATLNSNGSINVVGKKAADVTAGGWITLSFVVDYSTNTLTNTKINGTDYTISGYTLPSLDTLFASYTLWTYLYPGHCSGDNNVLYMDYFRVYSVKRLKYRGTNIDVNGMAQDERNIELYFNHPLDEISAIMSATLRDERGNYVNCMTGPGAEENILLFNLDNPLNYGACYTINIDGLQEKYDGDQVNISMTLKFFVENKPQYKFSDWSIGETAGKLNASVAVSNHLPKGSNILFLTQLYDAQNQLVSIQNSGVTAILPNSNAQAVTLFSDVSCPTAVKAEVFVFSESYQYILESYTLDIER